MITVNGIYLGDYLKVSQIRGRGFLPSQENIIVKVPGKNGGYFLRTTESPRILENDVSILEDDATALRGLVRTLGSILFTEGIVSIVYDDEPDITYYGKIGGSTDLAETVFSGKGTISFECPSSRSTGLEKTFNIDTSPKTIVNSGASETYPVINVVFTGAVTNFEISDGFETIKLIRSFALNDTVEIDFNTRKITYNGSISMTLLDLSSRWFNLKPGDNIITIAPFATVSITFNERWL